MEIFWLTKFGFSIRTVAESSPSAACAKATSSQVSSRKPWGVESGAGKKYGWGHGPTLSLTIEPSLELLIISLFYKK
jgi:hypothetical protein